MSLIYTLEKKNSFLVQQKFAAPSKIAARNNTGTLSPPKFGSGHRRRARTELGELRGRRRSRHAPASFRILPEVTGTIRTGPHVFGRFGSERNDNSRQQWRRGRKNHATRPVSTVRFRRGCDTPDIRTRPGSGSRLENWRIEILGKKNPRIIIFDRDKILLRTSSFVLRPCEISSNPNRCQSIFYIDLIDAIWSVMYFTKKLSYLMQF